MKKLLFISLICIATQLDAGWIRTYGGTETDAGSSVQQTSDGGYIITGVMNFYGGCSDVYLIKTDSLGDTLWTRTFGGPYFDKGHSVKQTRDGGYIISGEKQETGPYSSTFLIKTNSAGDTLWTKTLCGGNGYPGESVQQTTDGGYIIAGGINTGSSYDALLIKTDSAGDSLWIKTYGGSNWELAYSVQQTIDGGFIITGGTTSYGAGNGDVWLIKTDISGNVAWDRTFGGIYNDCGLSVQQTRDSGYIIAGIEGGTNANYYDAYLIRTNSIGNALWTRTYGNSGINSDFAYSVQQTIDSGYIITGQMYPYLWLIKTNSSGDTMWTKTFGTGRGNSVCQTSDKGFIITGQMNNDVCLIKTDSLGSLVGVEENSESKVNNLDFKLLGNKVYLSTPNEIPADIKVYDICGRLKSTLYEGILSKGTHTFTPSVQHAGIYFITLQSPGIRQTLKLIKL